MPTKRRLKTVAAGGLIFAAGLGTGTTAVKMHTKWVVKEKVQAQTATKAFQQLKSVRNPVTFGRLCGIYNWVPSSSKVSLIESVSKKTGIKPENVAFTIGKNEVTGNWVSTLDAKIASVTSQIKGFEQKILSLKSKQNVNRRKHFEAEVKRLKARANQVKRVKKVIGQAVFENQKLTESINKESVGKLDRVANLLKGKYP